MTKQAASNLDRLAAALDKAAGRMSDLDPAAAQTGALLVEVARRRVPTGQTGRLKASIRFNVRRSKEYRGGIRSSVTATASTPYAAPIHWGWKAHGITAQKFMAESLDRLDRSGKAVDIYTSAIVGALSKL